MRRYTPDKQVIRAGNETTVPRVGVIGGGLTGLSAALRAAELGAQVEIFEAEPAIGGLATSYTLGDSYTFDIGPHSFYPRRPDIAQFFEELMGDNILRIDIRGAIYRGGILYQYPWSVPDFLSKARMTTRAVYLFDYLLARMRFAASRKEGAANLEEWCINRFGKRFYNYFLSGHMLKSYGIPVAQLPWVWAAQRIHIPSLGESIGDLLSSSPRVGHAYYPKAGIGALSLALADRARDIGVAINCNVRVTGIHLNHGERMRLDLRRDSGKETMLFDSVISTGPLSEVIGELIPQAPRNITAIALQLRFRAAIFVFVKADTASLMNFSLCYFPSDDYTFIRLYEPRRYSTICAPQESSSLCVEIHCDYEDEIWQLPDDLLGERIISELSTVKFIGGKVAMTVLGIKRFRYHYPLPTVDKEIEELETYLSMLTPKLVVCGRLGSFRYINMDDAMLMGQAAAEVVDGIKTFADVLQVAERKTFIETGRRSG
jgi:protoporphyrinogen oxidase